MWQGGGPDEETQDAFDQAADTLSEVGKALESLDRAIRNSSPAAGMFVALYA